MARSAALLLVLAILTFGCEIYRGEVEVRACNETGYDVSELTYAGIDVGDLAEGACSAYDDPPFEVYRYTSVRFRVGDDEFLAQPIDYVGEKPLPAGRWSYEITIFDYENRRIDIEAVKR